MKYCKGFLVGAIILFVVNFFFGFMDNCTLSSLKESFSPKDSCEVKKDSVGEEVVNLNIEKYLYIKTEIIFNYYSLLLSFSFQIMVCFIFISSFQ